MGKTAMEQPLKTILLVDADPAENRLGEVLTSQGYQSLLAGDGLTALSIVKSGTTVDLVVSETELPDMDGMEFLLLLQRARPELPVIIVTAAGSLEKYLQAVNLGVVEYLAKPVFMKEFCRIVRLTLNRSAACVLRPGANHAVTITPWAKDKGSPGRGG